MYGPPSELCQDRVILFHIDFIFLNASGSCPRETSNMWDSSIHVNAPNLLGLLTCTAWPNFPRTCGGAGKMNSVPTGSVLTSAGTLSGARALLGNPSNAIITSSILHLASVCSPLEACMSSSAPEVCSTSLFAGPASEPAPVPGVTGSAAISPAEPAMVSAEPAMVSAELGGCEFATLPPMRTLCK